MMRLLVNYLGKLSPSALGVVALLLPFLTAVIAIGFFYGMVERTNVDQTKQELTRLASLSSENLEQALVRYPSDADRFTVLRAVFSTEAAAMRTTWPGLQRVSLASLDNGDVDTPAVSPTDARYQHHAAIAGALAAPEDVFRYRHHHDGEPFLSFAKVVKGPDGASVAVVLLDYDLRALNDRLLPVREAALFSILIALLLCYAISRLSANLRRSTLAAIEDRNRATELMREARDNAERARQAETELLAVAAHDLKNPLAAIRGFCEMTTLRLDREEPQEARRHIQRIAETSQSLLHMVENLLANAALGQDGFRLHNEVYDLRETIDETIRLNSLAAQRKEIRIHRNLPAPLFVAGDRVRLCEAIDNLVNNAVKYTPPGRRIEIAGGTVAGQLQLTVADEGPGLTPEDIKLAFGQFQRLSAQPTGGESSIGLGLSICKTIIEAHGGTVSCGNRPEGGAVFTAHLPNAADRAASPVPAPTESEPQPATP